MSFQRKLLALGYPNPPNTNDTSSSSSPSAAYTSLDSIAFRTLVVWLEFTKIRFYPVDQRESIKKIEQGPEWNMTFIKYLQDLECTRPYSLTGMTPDAVTIVLDWLLSQAIGAEYSDHAGEYNTLSRMWFVTGNGNTTAASSSSSSSSSAPSSSSATAAAIAASSSNIVLDCTSTPQEFEDEVKQLADMFRLPFERSQMTSIIRVIRKRVEESIVAAAQEGGVEAPKPAAAAAAAGASASAPKPTQSKSAVNKPSKSTGSSVSKPSSSVRSSRAAANAAPIPRTREEVFEALSKLELGFESTGDLLVDRAIQVFRLLFLHDLRMAQNLVNEVMMLAQEYTSDPKTDAKLGKVGV